MKITSKTGLTASSAKKVRYEVKTKTVQLKAISRPAPFVLKPFAGLYNPYSYGCSILCNHPTDIEAKDLLKKAKDNWSADGRNVLLTEEIEAIRTGLQQLNTNQKITSTEICIPQVESVPEELFRRYTETDSRPLTPAPTLASGATRISGSRRCVTPDLLPTNYIKEKTLLILDLRRSHSQETLSWYGSSSVLDPPLIRVQHVPTRTASLEDLKIMDNQAVTKSLSAAPPIPSMTKHPKSVKKDEIDKASNKGKEDADEDDEDDEFIKRRGKKRRKRGRDASRGPPAFQPSLDPETQVAAIDPDSINLSARPSLVPDVSLPQEKGNGVDRKRSIAAPQATKPEDFNSYLDREILKQLRRELNEEIVDNELNNKRREALEEALKTLTKGKVVCEELVALQKEIKVAPINADLWISLPRTFSRSSAIFELPMDSRSFSTLKPIEYARDMVNITSSRKLLYNCIFSKHKMEQDDDNDYKRKLHAKNLPACMDLIMGKPLNEKQRFYFKNLMGWNDEDIFDFKTCCGLFALCERLLAPEFCPQLPDRKKDPCHEIETADFEVLSRKLQGKDVDERLVEILKRIKYN